MPNYRASSNGTFVRSGGQTVYLQPGMPLPADVLADSVQLAELLANGRVLDDTSTPHATTGLAINGGTP